MIKIRPSSVAGFFDCPRKWYLDQTAPKRAVSSVAHFGTGLHKASEVYYTECIEAGSFVLPINDYESLAIDTMRERAMTDGMSDESEININEFEKSLAHTTRAYLKNAPVLCNGEIPIATEKMYSTTFNGYLVAGTLDLVFENSIVDIKTMARFKSAKSYSIQQAIYALLRAKQGEQTRDLIIHRVRSDGIKMDAQSILTEADTTMEALMARAETHLTALTATLKALEKSKRDDLLFRGNPQSMLCSDKWCAYWNECKFK